MKVVSKKKKKKDKQIFIDLWDSTSSDNKIIFTDSTSTSGKLIKGVPIDLDKLLKKKI